MPDPTPALQVTRRAGIGWWISGGVVILLLGLAIWYVNTPRDLPTSKLNINAATPIGIPVYVGVFNPDKDFDRTLNLSGVKVRATTSAKIKIEPLLCRNGRISVTSQPESFSPDMVNPEGQVFTRADSIVLRVTGDLAATALIESVKLGFREDLRWGTKPVGHPLLVKVLPR